MKHNVETANLWDGLMAEVYDLSDDPYEVKMERLIEWLIVQEVKRMPDLIPEEWEGEGE